MKKGVLIVSFGTSYREAEAQNINPVEQAISAALPGYGDAAGIRQPPDHKKTEGAGRNMH